MVSLTDGREVWALGEPHNSCFHQEDDAAEGLFEAYAARRDPTLREQLIISHLGLVTRLARRMVTGEDLLDDLIQVGYIGLIKAIDRYDPSKGVKFATYAVPTITGEIRRFLRDKGSIIRIPRYLQELRSRLRKTREGLTQELGREPSETEVAARLGLDVKRVKALQSVPSAGSVSLDHELGMLDEETFASLYTLFGQLDEQIQRSEERAVLRRALERLTPRQRAILHLLFYEDLSQAQIGELLNISQMHVSRLRRDALAKLRDDFMD